MYAVALEMCFTWCGCSLADGAMCAQSAPEAHVHFLVLTDAEGHKSFATCLTYYAPFVVERVSCHHIFLKRHISAICV